MFILFHHVGFTQQMYAKNKPILTTQKCHSVTGIKKKRNNY